MKKHMTPARFLKPALLFGFSLLGVLLTGCSLVKLEPVSPVSSQGSIFGPSNRAPERAEAPAPVVERETGQSPLEKRAANRLVGVFYATDRKPALNPSVKPYFLGEKNSVEDPITYGKCLVSIPGNHEPGVLESKRWWKFEFEEDPKKHVVIKSVSPLDPGSFFSRVESTAEQANEHRKMGKQVLLFVHGYNTPFELAMRRAGQLAWDLNFPGVPLAYTWPSVGKLSKYTDDESHAEWAKPHLAKVLMDLQENTDIDKIQIIAHSMGTRVLTGALLEAKAQGFSLKLNNVVLAAADISADEFKFQIMPKIRGDAERLTLFANSDDRALQVSSHLHSAPRLGRSGDNIVVLPGMDTIDATKVDRSFVGHSYFGGNSLMLRDLINLIIYNESPAQRRLTLQPNGAWTFFR